VALDFTIENLGVRNERVLWDINAGASDEEKELAQGCEHF